MTSIGEMSPAMIHNLTIMWDSVQTVISMYGLNSGSEDCHFVRSYDCINKNIQGMWLVEAATHPFSSFRWIYLTTSLTPRRRVLFFFAEGASGMICYYD